MLDQTWQGHTPVGYDKNSFSNMQLDVGEFHHGLDWSWVTPASDSRELADFLQKPENRKHFFGATEGGGSFSANAEYREVLADNVLVPLARMIQSVEITLSTDVKEFKVDTFKLALPTAFEDESGWIKATTTLLPEHYIDNVSWCGRLGDGRLVAIVIHNAINTTGLNLTLNNQGEGTVNLEFQANSTGGQEFPFKMRVFPLPGNTAPGAEGFTAFNAEAPKKGAGK